MLQMFTKIAIGLAILVGISIAYVVGKAYWNGTMRLDAFQNKVKTVSAQQQVRPAVEPTPAPAPVVTKDASPEPPREIAPGGPNPPAARSPPLPPKLSPEAQAMDPYEEKNSLAPIRDSLRHPENSFGPGVANTGTDVSVGAGIASVGPGPAGSNTFSPEFAQNGGEWLSGVSANDAVAGDEFATF